MDASTSMHWKDILRHERILRNWRQQDLADELETTVATIKRWERGSQLPGPYFRMRLCALFGKSAEEMGFVAASIPSSDIYLDEQATSSQTKPPGLWMVPLLRNPHFTGRADLLGRLAQHLSLELGVGMTTRQAALSQRQAIKGLGGIGKTQIAVEYAYRMREQGRYIHTFWINASSQEAIITGFQALADQLPDFAARDEKDQQKLIAAVLHWLQECQEPWLLILDNADDLALVQPYIPTHGYGSILLTTRAHAVASLANSIEVDRMELIEGTQFLLRRTQRLLASDEECNEASNIVIALDGFPLALDQAGAYIEETGCGFSDYLQLYDQHRTQLLARRGRQTTNYPDSVATTWSLSFQKVEQAYPAAAELLRLCAFLSPDHIPEELITEGALHWPTQLREAVVDSFSFNGLLGALLAFSLIKRLAQEHLLSLHRLVQVVQIDQMNLQEQRQWAGRVVGAVNELFPADPKNEVDTWPRCLRYLEQVQACEQLIQQHCLQSSEAVDVLERAGIYLREHASHSLAEQLFQRALSIAEQQPESRHLQIASLVNNLGELYRGRGQHQQAEPLFQRAIHIREQVLGLDHPSLASPLNNLGLLYSDQGQYEQAEPLLQRSISIWEQSSGAHDPQLAYPLNNLGLLYAKQHRYELAEPLLQRAIHIREQSLSLNHPQLAYPLTNLGEVYSEQGQYEQAEPLFQRALSIWEKALGPDHPLLGYPFINLGELYGKQGQYGRAEEMFQQALRIWEQALGSHHPLVAVPLNNLGNLYKEQGQYERAEEMFQQARMIENKQA